MAKTMNASFLESTVEKMTKKRNNFGAALCVEQGDDNFSWTGAAGNIEKDDQFFIASVTKLYVTAVVLMLKGDGRLQLEDRITDYLSEDIMKGIHVLEDVDHSSDITIKHLISNTSGIPDYFSGKQSNGKTVQTNLFNGYDEGWPLEETLKMSKSQKPKFKPGQSGKANYSDTNYQLLGKIIENITGLSISEVFQTFIFDALELSKTYVFEDISDVKPVPLYYRSNAVHLPKYMSSVSAEGGIVSNAEEMMIFLKAFFNGRFFPKEELETLKEWNLILFPAQFSFGIGLEKLWVPRIYTPFNPIKEILGFWGQSGAFAFYNPEKDLCFTGTVNQSSGLGHISAYKAMLKIIKENS